MAASDFRSLNTRNGIFRVLSYIENKILILHIFKRNVLTKIGWEECIKRDKGNCFATFAIVLVNVDSIMDKAFSIQKRLCRLFCTITVHNTYGESSEFCLQFDYFHRDWPNQDNCVAKSDLRRIKCACTYVVSAEKICYCLFHVIFFLFLLYR